VTEPLDRLMAALSAADEEAQVSVPGLTGRLLHHFGGEDGFAKKIVDVAENCESSQTQARLMSLAAEMVVQQAKLGEEKNIGRLSDEELREGIDSALPALVEDLARNTFGEGFEGVTLGQFLGRLKGAA
jgi:hypothetical protein